MATQIGDDVDTQINRPRTIEQNGNNLLMVRTRMNFYVKKEREQLAEKKSFFPSFFSLLLLIPTWGRVGVMVCAWVRGVRVCKQCACVSLTYAWELQLSAHTRFRLYVTAAFTLLRHTNADARFMAGMCELTQHACVCAWDVCGHLHHDHDDCTNIYIYNVIYLYHVVWL